MTLINNPAPKHTGHYPRPALPPGIPAAGTPTPTPASYDAPRGIRKSRPLPTEWAKVGGAGFTPGPTNEFLTEAFRDRYRPGDEREIYLGGCNGLAELSRIIAAPAYKVSTCAAGRLDLRMFELCRDRYGAWQFDGGKFVMDPGWDSWFPSHLHPRQRPSPASPVQARPRSVQVRLPAGMTAEEFDRAFDLETRKGALDLWSLSDDARKHCAILGVDPAIMQRFTEYPGWRRSPAAEICGVTIYTGADRVIALAEAIILRHLIPLT